MTAVAASGAGLAEGGKGESARRGAGVTGGMVAAVFAGAAILSLGVTVATRGAAGGARGDFVAMVAVVVCGAAALFDARTARIPNRLTYTAIVAGLLLNGVAGLAEHWRAGEGLVRWLSAAGPAQSGLGFGVCAAAGLLAMVLRLAGGGDVKLLAGIGALLGLVQTGEVLIVALTAAVVLAVVNLAVAGRLNVLMRMVSARVMELMFLGRVDWAGYAFPEPGATRIPMAVPLAIGVVVQCVPWGWMHAGGAA